MWALQRMAGMDLCATLIFLNCTWHVHLLSTILKPRIMEINGTPKTFVASLLKVLDESMSPFWPRTIKKGGYLGGLPHIVFILRKPEPLGMEFKVHISMLCFKLQSPD
jgi:hypothetical protein